VEPEVLPDLRDLLTAVHSGWRAQAACRDEPDDTLFLSDKTLPHNQPGSPSVLLALLTCAECSVRPECLREAMTPVTGPLPRWNSTAEQVRGEVGIHRVMLGGVWGGATEVERVALRDVPIPEAVERLERTFPKRLDAVARAFERTFAGRIAKRYRPARARQLLAKPEVAALLAVTRRRCLSCSRRLPALGRTDARYCSVRCRVSAHRAKDSA